MKQSVIAGIVLALIGAVMCVSPAKIWNITERWKSGGTSPSAAYIIISRIVGAAFAIVGILLAAGIIR